MFYEVGAAEQGRLQSYFDGVGSILGDKRRRASFAMYAYGILGDGERKSVEPIAARACGNREEARATHEKLLHFVGRSGWDDEAVRQYGNRHAIDAMVQREPVEAWIVDDTGFIKQGSESPGVQRQYTGSAGKRTNCQIAVSLTIATRTEQLPVDMELYLPESWTEDRKRRRKARIPTSVTYTPKWEMSLQMIEHALAVGIPPGLVLADSFYGDAAPFRDGVLAAGLQYAVDVKVHTRVRLAGADPGEPQSVLELARSLRRQAFRKVTWREGTRTTLSSRFAAVRVCVSHSDRVQRDEEWLLIEWPDGEPEPTHYVLSTLGKSLSRKELVRRVKQRWRIERTYEDLKGELGLDHFEGRSWTGWNHHVTVVLCCYAFIVAERVRRFPPSSPGSQGNCAVPRAA
jgi:SRSO17 transposase